MNIHCWMRYFLHIIIVFSSTFLFGANITYDVAMPLPHTHYFNVTMNIVHHQRDYIDVKMPVWAPGSYLVREFSKNVEEITAVGNNDSLWVEQLTKNTWRVHTNQSDSVSISYKVYAFELSVRTSFLDASHGYFNGTSMFFYVDELKHEPVVLNIKPYKGWKKISTALSQNGNKTYSYKAENYDELVDAPVEIGNHQTFDFTSAGVVHHVALYGDGNFNVEQLSEDMSKIVEAATAVFGVNPNKEYTFIIHNLTRGSGGLEHANSTTLQVNRWTYEGKAYQRFLSLVAHEYFHLWNVKRIRPEVLGPFDYENENYTSLLWVMEGFTSYYDELLLYRAGLYDEEEFVEKIEKAINVIENKPGNKVQSVADASFNAWIKAYRPNENSYNTTISYYTKGMVIAAMLDLIIAHETKGNKNLDDVMRLLYQEFYLKQHRGFTDKEMKQSLESIAGVDLTGFYERHINGTLSFDYDRIFGYAGYSVEMETDGSPYLGVLVSDNHIKRVARGSSAHVAGLNVNDELIAIDGFRVNDNISDFIDPKNVGDTVNVLFSRDNVMQSLDVPLLENRRVNYYISDLDKKKNKVAEKWLKKE